MDKSTETRTLSGEVAKLPRVRCEHCGVYVSKNVYSRNHGAKCSYKEAPRGYKRCRCCGQFVALTSFALVSVNTFDGRNATCNQCLGRKYYKPALAI